MVRLTIKNHPVREWIEVRYWFIRWTVPFTVVTIGLRTVARTG